ncbi:MAG: Flp family type IVb pilin [Burkholderiales bacterium]|nr:Flp family type IVb pilin [Burkholderiales bacterium]
MKAIMKFLKEEDGATAVEYALMVALIAGAVIIIVTALGNTIKEGFKEICNAINTTLTTKVSCTT